MSSVPAAADRIDQVGLDTGTMPLHVWVPDAGHGPGIVLVSEIFGVNGYIDSVARRLTALGYVVGAPELFWRVAPAGWIGDRSEAGLKEALGFVGQLDLGRAIADSVAALAHLAAIDEVDGTPGVLGFCMGGAVAWLVAADAAPSVAVGYYGSRITGAVDRATDISCPVLLHFGATDGSTPPEAVEQVRAALAGHGSARVEVHDAGARLRQPRCPGHVRRGGLGHRLGADRGLPGRAPARELGEFALCGQSASGVRPDRDPGGQLVGLGVGQRGRSTQRLRVGLEEPADDRQLPERLGLGHRRSPTPACARASRSTA